MAIRYWLVFGLITTFYVPLMDLFQTAEGVAAMEWWNPLFAEPTTQATASPP